MNEAKKLKPLQVWIAAALLICLVALALPLWKEPLLLAGLAAPLLVAAVVIINKWARAGLVLLAIYLTTYGVLSSSGHFKIANHGGNDWRREWCPKWLMQEYTAPSGRSKTGFTPMGVLFWPCILLDHLLWHRTQEVLVP